MTTDNLDLRVKRREVGLTLDDMSIALGCDISSISRFERGYRSDLPGGLGRADYERVLREHASDHAEFVSKETGR